MAVCYYKQGHREKGLHSLLRGLAYGAPRDPELCCDLGGWFLEEQMWETAVYWYEQALQAPRPEKGFCRENGVGGTYLVYSCVCAGIGWEIMTRLSIITKRLADGIQGGRIFEKCSFF